jgi:hypothetical protein
MHDNEERVRSTAQRISSPASRRGDHHFTHWLGALITNDEIIGTMDTPVRAVIDGAAAFVSTPVSLMAPVVTLAYRDPNGIDPARWQKDNGPGASPPRRDRQER